MDQPPVEPPPDELAALVSPEPLAELRTLPVHGELIHDARGGGRWLRATWHHEADVIVLSVWREGVCVATSRIARDEVPMLVSALVAGLAGPPADA
jgi:hypothetical protein